MSITYYIGIRTNNLNDVTCGKPSSQWSDGGKHLLPSEWYLSQCI